MMEGIEKIEVMELTEMQKKAYRDVVKAKAKLEDASARYDLTKRAFWDSIRAVTLMPNLSIEKGKVYQTRVKLQ